MDPLLQRGVTVHLYVSMRVLNANDTTKLWLALKSSSCGLGTLVVAERYYRLQESNAFVTEAMHHISKRNASATHNVSVVNRPKALMRQYFARFELGRLIQTHSKKHAYDIVVYCRSDLYFHRPTRYIPNDHKGFKSALALWDHFSGKEYSKRLAWLPQEEDHLLGWNDHLVALTAPLFSAYQRTFKRFLFNWLDQGGLVHGETIHRHMLEASGAIPYRIYVCYGVRRAFNCDWTMYGNDACLVMNLSPIGNRSEDVDPSSRSEEQRVCSVQDQEQPPRGALEIEPSYYVEPTTTT